MAKKRAQAKPDVQMLAPIVDAQPSAQPSNATGDWWSEDLRREQALEMFLEGSSKAAVSRKLGVHRNTINNWCADPRFIAEANARLNEIKASTRIRRLRTTGAINGTLEKMSLALTHKLEGEIIDKKTGEVVESIPKETGRSLGVLRQLLYEFRQMREEERKDFGDDVKKVNVTSHQTITGDVHVNHQGLNNTPFVDYVRRSLNNRVIDVNAIESHEGEPNGKLLLRTAEHLLVDSNLLEEINEEDKALEDASK